MQSTVLLKKNSNSLLEKDKIIKTKVNNILQFPEHLKTD